jgi:hypothetical protein
MPQQRAAQRALRGEAVVDALQEHGVVVDGQAGHAQAIAGPGALGGHLAGVVEVGLDPDLVGGREDRDQLVVVEPLRQGDRDARADADDVDVLQAREARQEELELLQGHGQGVAAGDDDVADLGVVADVLDHAAVVARDGVPAAALHRGALARAEPAIHGADVRRDQQRAVGVAVGQAGDRRVLVLVERVLFLGAGGAGQLRGGGDRLEPDRIGRVEPIDQGEVVRGDRQLVLGLEDVQGAPILDGEGEQLGQLPGVADGVLRLPPPVVPLVVGDVGPGGVAGRSGRAWGGAGNWEARRHPGARSRRGWRRGGLGCGERRPSWS